MLGNDAISHYVNPHGDSEGKVKNLLGVSGRNGQQLLIYKCLNGQ